MMFTMFFLLTIVHLELCGKCTNSDILRSGNFVQKVVILYCVAFCRVIMGVC